MNTPLLRARDIEAYALSTLTAAPVAHPIAGRRAANPVPIAGRFPRARRVLLIGAILGIAALAFGFPSSRVFTPAAAQTQQSPKVTAAKNEPRATATEPLKPANVLRKERPFP